MAHSLENFWTALPDPHDTSSPENAWAAGVLYHVLYQTVIQPPRRTFRHHLESEPGYRRNFTHLDKHAMC